MRTTKTLRLMPDYGCYPLWQGGGEVGNVDPTSLPLTRSTVESLERWAEKYDAILNQDDPASSGFSSRQEERDFVDEGWHLQRVVQQELGADYVIVYDPSVI